ncbi:MAG: 4Fe-4S dicluster domain-containing protein [Candidatus Nanoarchaeia archaeon]
MDKALKKSDFKSFFNDLQKDYELIGPVKKDNVVKFDKLNSADELYFDEQTQYSLRKYFLPDGEKVFEYKNNKPTTPQIDIKKRIIFLRPCDANALENIDKVYLDEFPDINYKKRRENTFLFVFKCTEPYENCFCTCLGTDQTDNFDLLFSETGDKYIVKSKGKAEKFTEKKIFTPVLREDKRQLNCNKSIALRKLEEHKEDPKWEEAADKCLNCNACITVCPTCMCFSIQDETNPDLKTGKRKRYWDFCHMKDFTKVAGGLVFRENKINRFRHRIYHKLKYFYDRNGRHLCVGCGRCINVCPSKLDMVKIVNSLGKNGKRK